MKLTTINPNPFSRARHGAGMMPRRPVGRIWRLACALLLLLLSGAPMAAPAPVMVLTLAGAISPATADYAVRGIARAEQDGVQLVVLEIDTPGGLDTSMRVIIKSILSSPVPVAAYVAPSGARAASAGTYILYASHVAAMAPGTNLGAATPVEIGLPSTPEKPNEPASQPNKKGDATKTPADAGTSPMTRKQVNDAVAYIRGLAQLRGRNAEWAEQAVREAVSLPAQEALKQHVVDIVADDLAGLLKQLDGRKLTAAGQDRQLHTAGAPVVRYQPDWRVRLLAVITDPGIALILMAIGIYGLIFEFMVPGMVLPGVLGGICLLLALYALQLLPVNYAGLALITLGIAFMVSEAFLPSGALGFGGVAAFVIGAVILIDTEQPGFGVPRSAIATIAILGTLLMATIAGITLRTRRRAVVIGDGELIGKIADVVEASGGQGWARVHGENWRVTSTAPLHPAQKVRVLARHGLVLDVSPIDHKQTGETP